MEYKDYYKILGVDRNAGEDEIKRSYRKLAMQYHPDRNPGDSKAEEKFKEINEAYQVLGDAEKRARYNQLGESYSRWQQSGRSPGGFNWDEWYTTAPGGNVRVEVGNIEDLFAGGGLGDFSEFFRRIFGGMGRADFERGAYGGTYSGARGGARPDSRYATPDIQHEIEITLSEAFHGTTRRLEVDGRRLEVKIPRGARTGTKIRVANAVTGRDGQRSDLYLVVKLANDPNFERKGNDLYTDVSIDLYKAVLGGEVTVRTLAGNLVLTIPAGTQPGQSIRLAGQGMSNIKNPDQRGDLFVRVRVKIPRNITPEQRELFKKLEQLG